MKRWQANLILGIVALIWGSTFVMVQNALDAVDPLSFVGLRFIVATLCLLVLFGKRVRGVTRAELIAGGLIGVWLVGGYAFQTIGLESTTTAKAGFITGLSVVIVPLLSTVLLLRPPGRGPVLGIVAATGGLALLTLNINLSIQTGAPWVQLTLDDGFSIQPGDLWVLACAFMFALHIVSVARYSPQYDSIRLSIIQIAVVAPLALTGAFAFEKPTLDLPASTWGAIIFTGVVATALVFSLQVYVQRFTTPTHTALLFALEPVFAAFFGWWLANEELGSREIVGCALILLGMVFAELGDSAAEPDTAPAAAAD